MTRHWQDYPEHDTDPFPWMDPEPVRRWTLIHVLALVWLIELACFGAFLWGQGVRP